MLALHHAPSSSPNYAFTPATAPPALSPRSANIHGLPRAHLTPMSHDSNRNAPPRASGDPSHANPPENQNMFPSASMRCADRPRLPYAQRPIKRVPTPKPDALGENRRSTFLRKVARHRAAARHGARGEDIMRMDFIQRQEAWEAERRREADAVSRQDEVLAEQDQGDAELPRWSADVVRLSPTAPTLEDEVEEFVKDEEAELKARLENLPRDDEGGLWSDGADYDELFEEVWGQHGPGQKYGRDRGGSGDEMDLS